MAKKSKNKGIAFNLSKISTDQFAIFEDKFVEEKPLILNTNLTFGVNKDERKFMVTTKFVFLIEDNPFMTVQVTCYFGIDEKTWNDFIQDDDKIVLPRGFVAHLGALTVGTTRGVLHSKTENTKFNKFLIPPTNVSKLVEHDVTFS